MRGLLSPEDASARLAQRGGGILEQDMTDREMLLAYQRDLTTENFSRLVAAHVDLVYSVARGGTWECAWGGGCNLSTVFLTLAHGAGFRARTFPWRGWLFTTTRFVAAARAMRWSETRRKRRETEGRRCGTGRGGGR